MYVKLQIEREGEVLADLGVYQTLDDAKKAALNLEFLYEGCEAIAYQGEKIWLLTDDWKEITFDEGQPDWQQEWEDFGETYDDEPNYL